MYSNLVEAEANGAPRMRVAGRKLAAASQSFTVDHGRSSTGVRLALARNAAGPRGGAHVTAELLEDREGLGNVKLRVFTLALDEAATDESWYAARWNGVDLDPGKTYRIFVWQQEAPDQSYVGRVLWGYDSLGESRAVDVHIRRLRAKLERRWCEHLRAIVKMGDLAPAHEARLLSVLVHSIFCGRFFESCQFAAETGTPFVPLAARIGVFMGTSTSGVQHTELAYREWFVPHGAVYLTTVGYGLGAAYGKCIRGVREVHWLEELGIAQALWVLEVERLGPFLVEGDAQGRSLFALANREITRRLAEVYAGLPPYAMSRYGESTPEREIV